jgi:[ribosomal protein S5]-alanine N-acetyltransferase
MSQQPSPVHARLTARLCLRAPTAADLDALFEIYADPATQRFNPAGPLASREAAGHLMWRWQLHWAQHGFGIWVVCQREAPEQVLGFGGLSWREYGDTRRLNLGFRLRPSAWGQGLATELGQAALALAFEELDQAAVYALVRPDNLPSRKTLAKLGLQPVGELQDFPWLSPSSVYCLARASQQLPVAMSSAPALAINAAQRVARPQTMRSKQLA